MYLMPGFVDAHVHCGGGQANVPEYVYKLWLASGVTTVRGVPCGSMDWDLAQRELSAKNQIVAPRIFAYHRPFTGEGWDRTRPQTPESAREWVRFAAKKGVDGLKLGAHDPEIMAALLDEAKKHNLGSTAHLDQMGVGRMTALDASRLGLGAMTHYYGLFESLYKDTSIQPYEPGINYNDEQHRFGQVARNWNRIHPRGSEKWNALIKEWVDGKFIIDPTMTIYSAGRDVMRMRNADWHEKYTLPVAVGLLPAQPLRARRLLVRLDDRGRSGVEEVLPGLDGLHPGLQERRRPRHDRLGLGLHLPDLRLRLHRSSSRCCRRRASIRSRSFARPPTTARRRSHEPKGKPIEFGLVRAGLKADFVITKENPLQNFKTLYITGAVRLDDATNKPGASAASTTS